MRRRLTVFAAVFIVVAGVITGHFDEAEVAAQPIGNPTYEARLLELVNLERWGQGQLPPLKATASLGAAAEAHSRNMAARNFFAHCDLDTGTSPWDRISSAGYGNWNLAGENIAAGFNAPEAVLRGWMNSPGHRANILSETFRETGIGYENPALDERDVREGDVGACRMTSGANGPYFHYWTQEFGRRSDHLPVVINREMFETPSRQVQLYQYGRDWAESMRFRNESGQWSEWQSYEPDISWLLSCGSGQKTVIAEVSNGAFGAGLRRQTSDVITLSDHGTELLNTQFSSLTAVIHGRTPATEATRSLTLINNSDQPVAWRLIKEPAAAWLSAFPAAGTVAACSEIEVILTYSATRRLPGLFETTLRLEGDRPGATPQSLTVTFFLTERPPVGLPLIQGP